MEILNKKIKWRWVQNIRSKQQNYAGKSGNTLTYNSWMSQKLSEMGLYSVQTCTHGFIQYIPMYLDNKCCDGNLFWFTIHGLLQSIFSNLKTVGTIFCEHLLLFSYVKNCNAIFVKSQNKATFIIQIHCVCDLYYLYPL